LYNWYNIYTITTVIFVVVVTAVVLITIIIVWVFELKTKSNYWYLNIYIIKKKFYNYKLKKKKIIKKNKINIKL